MDDYAGNSSTNGYIFVGDIALGTIDDIGIGTDADWFSVDLIAGNTYVFTCMGASNWLTNALADPYLRLRNSNGGIVAFNDDISLFDTNSRIEFTATQTGRHYLDVQPYSQVYLGSYQVSADLTGVGIDITPPAITHFEPAKNGTGVNVAQNIEITFDEAVIALGNTLGTLWKSNNAGGWTLVETFTGSAGTASLFGNSLTFNPTANLALGTQYRVSIDPNLIRDSAGNNFNGESNYVFTTTNVVDRTPPAIVSTTPSDGSVDNNVKQSISIIFNEAIRKGNSPIVLESLIGNRIEVFQATSDRVSVRGNELIIDPSADLESYEAYRVVVYDGAIEDLSGNRFSGSKTLNFSTVRSTDTMGPTIAVSGTRLLDFNAGDDDRARDIELLPDGKLLVLLQQSFTSNPKIALARFNPDLTLDLSYGQNGIIADTLGGEIAHTYMNLDVDGSGRAVVLARRWVDGSASALVARYLPDGSPDVSFGTQGYSPTIVSTDYYPYLSDSNILVQPDNKSLALIDADYGIKVIRLRSDGSFDPSFNSDGTAQLDIGPSTDVSGAFALTQDGGILIGASSFDPIQKKWLAKITRLLPNGDLDSQFGENGTIDISLTATSSRPTNIIVLPDNSFISAGNTGNDYFLAKFRADGSPDTTFGLNGKLVHSAGPYKDSITVFSNNQYGGYWLGGSIETGSNNSQSQTFIARYTANGQRDITFGEQGLLILPPAGDQLGGEILRGLVELSDGRLVLLASGAGDIALNRLMPDGSFDLTFNPPSAQRIDKITIPFSEPIDFGAGKITLKSQAGNVVQVFDVFNPEGLSISGNSLELTPKQDLVESSYYQLDFDYTSVTDIANNPTNATKYSFFTETISRATWIAGSSGVDVITGGIGNQRIEAGPDIDTAIFSRSIDSYDIELSGPPLPASELAKLSAQGIDTYLLSLPEGAIKITSLNSTEGIDGLVDVERVQFAGSGLAFDLEDHAGKVAKILAAVFGPSSLQNSTYVGIGLDRLDAGESYESLVALAINVTGAQSPENIVHLLWSNLFNGATPTPDEAAPFVQRLKSGEQTVGQLGIQAADYAAAIGVVDLGALELTGLAYR